MDKMNTNSCFGANIYDLMKNQFFMENTVGEFATKKLNNLAKEIEGLNRGNEENIEDIEYFVDQIGETVIRKILKKKLEDRKRRLKLLNNTKYCKKQFGTKRRTKTEKTANARKTTKYRCKYTIFTYNRTTVGAKRKKFEGKSNKNMKWGKKNVGGSKTVGI